MQQILIGNPLQLTGEGLLALHKLKYPETYCYAHTWDYIGLRDEYGEWSHMETVNESIKLVSKEEFLYGKDEGSQGINYYLLPVKLGTDDIVSFDKELESVVQPDNNNTSPHELLWFYNDWIYPKEEFRTDRDLVNLFHTDIRREYFIYEDLPRVIIIPSDIDWYLDENDMSVEYIQEKARSWS